jgi:hypothetical protein
VPNVKVRTEAHHSVPPLSLSDLLWEGFTFLEETTPRNAQPIEQMVFNIIHGNPAQKHNQLHHELNDS